MTLFSLFELKFLSVINVFITGNRIIKGRKATILLGSIFKFDRTYHYLQSLCWNLFLVQRKVDVYSAGDGASYHGVVANTEESHHLNVCGNGR